MSDQGTVQPMRLVWDMNGTSQDGSFIRLSKFPAQDISDAVLSFVKKFPDYYLTNINGYTIDSNGYTQDLTGTITAIVESSENHGW